MAAITTSCALRALGAAALRCGSRRSPAEEEHARTGAPGAGRKEASPSEKADAVEAIPRRATALSATLAPTERLIPIVIQERGAERYTLRRQRAGPL